MLRMQNAHRYGVKIGFKSFNHSSHNRKSSQEEGDQLSFGGESHDT